MAESTLLISTHDKNDALRVEIVSEHDLEYHRIRRVHSETDPKNLDAHEIVSCGRIQLDQKVKIVNLNTDIECQKDEVGEIWASGPSTAKGYWGMEKETERIFRAYLSDTGEGPFMRTGDLGFLQEGELYVTGRLKDLIIIRGRNYYPQDIELTVQESSPSIRANHVAAFSVEVEGEDRLVIVGEVERRRQRQRQRKKEVPESHGYRIARKEKMYPVSEVDTNRPFDPQETIEIIQEAVASHHELQVYAAALIRYGSLPKTSSGKIQHGACRKAFLENRLRLIGESILEDIHVIPNGLKLSRENLARLPIEQNSNVLTEHFRHVVAEVTRIRLDQIDPTKPIVGFGLDSLSAVELHNRLESDFEISIAISPLLQDMTINELVSEALNLLEKPIEHFERVGDVNIFPLSYNQRAQWLLYQMAPYSAAYNIFISAKAIFSETLQIDLLKESFDTVIKRHASLRTVYSIDDDQPIQHIRDRVDGYWEYLHAEDWSQKRLDAYLHQVVHQPFHLETGPIIRMKVLRRSDTEHIFLLVAHHISVDLWSLLVVFDEFGQLYAAKGEGKLAVLPPHSVSYLDFVHQQAQILEGESGDKLRAYWEKKLSGELPVLRLPTDRPRPSVQRTDRGDSFRFNLKKELAEQLKRVSSELSATLFTLLLAAFKTLLYRYSGQEDILVGAPASGRDQAEFTDIVGYMVNPVAIRSDLSGNPIFSQFVGQVRRNVLGALDHQDYPFQLLVEKLKPVREADHSPIFQAMFVLQRLQRMEKATTFILPIDSPETCNSSRMEWGGVTIESLPIKQKTAQFDLLFMLVETDQGMTVSIEYNTDLFDESTIQRMSTHYQTVLMGIVDDPEKRVADLPLLTTEERDLILYQWNQTRAAYPKHICLHHLFEAQVEKTPDRVALICDDASGNKSLTYKELNLRINRVAHYLKESGIKPDQLVGVCLERSFKMVIALYAALKAGAAYLPLDPTNPRERISYVIHDAQPDIIVTADRYVDRLPESEKILCLDQEESKLASYPADNPDSGAQPNHLAYVIYTSGSTGRPKGVMTEHRAICNRLLWMQDAYKIGETDTVLQKTPYTFDVSVWEFFWPLFTGARLVIARPQGHKDSRYLIDIIQRQKITTLHFVPSMLQLFLEEFLEEDARLCDSLRRVICSGESLSLELQKHFFSRFNCDLHNLYGPTEAAVDVSYWHCEPKSQLPIVPIGRPISNIRLYILSSRLQPAPPGVPGELHIGGSGLARGYHNRPELTAKKFIPDPFSHDPKARLYKTGDLARYMPDGAIEYIGRIDNQVKIRGNRVELGEIEVVLKRHPSVRDAIATTWKDQFGDLSISAYVISEEKTVSDRELLGYLKEKLPDYMIPATFATLDRFPLTSSGKIDRRTLPSPSQIRAQNRTKIQTDLSSIYVRPRTTEEEALTSIWENILDIKQVGIDDNIFDIGADSIRCIRFISRAKKIGSAFTLHQLLQYQTVRELTDAAKEQIEIESLQTQPKPFDLIHAEDRAKMPEDVVDAYPLAALQAGMIFHSRFSKDATVYHDVFSFRIRAQFDYDALRRATRQVIESHPALRVGFVLSGYKEPLQLVYKSAEVPLGLTDLRDLPEEERETAQDQWLKTERCRSLDLSKPPALYFKIHLHADDLFNLTISFHHAILDGWSVASLLTELFHRYLSILNDSVFPEPTPDKTQVEYRDFVAMENVTVQSHEAQEFWADQLVDMTLSKLPRWKIQTESEEQEKIGLLEVRDTQIPKKTSDLLKELARRANVPIKSVLLAAHLQTLRLLHNQSDITTGLVTNGRIESIGGEKTLGLFLNTLPFRMRLGSGTWLDLIRETFRIERDAIPYRRFPLAKIQRLFRDKTAFNGEQNDLFETAFNFIHFHVYEALLRVKDIEVVDWHIFEQTNFTLGVNFGLDIFTKDVTLSLSYDSAKLTKKQVEMISGYYIRTLEVMAKNPTQPFDKYEVISDAERHKLLVKWNNTQTDLPKKPVHEMFMEQARRNPDRIALVDRDQTFTYRELDRVSNQLAHYLKKLGVKPEVIVGLCVERSPEMAIGTLGILKAGGAYLPLDPNYPQDRLNLMIKDSQTQIILTTSRLTDKLSANKARIICFDTEKEVISQEPTYAVPTNVSEEHPAYVIYTSGSTGTPKGVVIVHRGFANLTYSQTKIYGIDSDSRMLQFISFSFDVAISDISMTFSTGAALYLLPRDFILSAENLMDEIEKHSITHIQLPVATLQALSYRKLPSLKTIMVGGESCSAKLAQTWGKGRKFFNAYGPTETTIAATIAECQDDGKKPTIGKPIANYQIYILDSRMQPVPTGTPAELYIGGAGLARGYLNRFKLTEEKFVPNPFDHNKSTRLYRSGDLGRFLPDGNIEFLGRIDNQLKIRGFRVEPDEIESVVSRHDKIKEAVVVVCQNKTEQGMEKRIIAYLVPHDPRYNLVEEIREYSKSRLPAYMIPSNFMFLNKIPLTPNGKVDRKNLPDPIHVQAKTVAYTQPKSKLERMISNIWKEELQLERVSIDANFFELGGHSLLMIRVHDKLKIALGKEIPMTDLFQYPTVRALANHLSQDSESSSESERSAEIRKKRERRQKAGKQRGQARRERRRNRK